MDVQSSCLYPWYTGTITDNGLVQFGPVLCTESALANLTLISDRTKNNHQMTRKKTGTTFSLYSGVVSAY